MLTVIICNRWINQDLKSPLLFLLTDLTKSLFSLILNWSIGKNINTANRCIFPVYITHVVSSDLKLPQHHHRWEMHADISSKGRLYTLQNSTEIVHTKRKWFSFVHTQSSNYYYYFSTQMQAIIYIYCHWLSLSNQKTFV